MTYTDKLFVILFLVLFASCTTIKYWTSSKEWVIVLFSLVLILSWGWFSLVVFLGIVTINYGAMYLISSVKTGRYVMIGAIVLDLAALAVFKYSSFFGSIVHAGTGLTMPAFSLGLPLAISFYTFHLISYLVDLQSGTAKLVPVRHYYFYLAFFPHLVAGPIVRPWQLMPQIGKIRQSVGDYPVGLHNFAVGFLLKAVVANNIATIIDPIWDSNNPGFELTSGDRIVVAFFYYCQIYCDFCGYTLMALGMARLLGYRLPPNFRQPMFAGSLQDFWRRWHISLSRWFRDYLYKPLGGSRGSKGRTLVNLVLTMVLGGLWHGAGWSFVLWGFVHGFGLVAERVIGGRRTGRGFRAANWAVAQIWVTVAWVFFRQTDYEKAISFIIGMVPTSADSLLVHSQLGVGFVFALLAIAHQVLQFVAARRLRRYAPIVLALTTAVAIFADILVFSPAKTFIYFTF